jgi:hypothetical protein
MPRRKAPKELTSWNEAFPTDARAANDAWLDGQTLSLPCGMIVRARMDIDTGIADVKEGDLGIVFGETNCYSDGAGPIVRWFSGKEVGGVTNVYPWTAEAIDFIEFES